MVRFNKVVKEAKTATTNRAGGDAYKQTTELELVGVLLTSFMKDQYYRSAKDTEQELAKLIMNLPDKLFAAKAALYARCEFGMRSVTHLVAAEIGKSVKAEQWTKRFFEKIVKRPDDAAEILSAYLSKYGKPLPNSMKKGIGAAISNLDEYTLAKYKGEGHALKMIDIVNLVHPKPSEKSSVALQKLVKDELKSFDTWESKLSEAGQKAETDEEKEELKNAAWKDLISERKIGYFALLRNLRNISAQAPDQLDAALEMLVDPKLIKKSLVLPFRFITAMKALQIAWAGSYSDYRNRQLYGDAKPATPVAPMQLAKMQVAINEALEISLDNVPSLPGTTLVALDDSGSMTSITAQGGETPQIIGSLFAAILAKRMGADVLQFSDTARYQPINPADSVTSIAQFLMREARGAGTNFHSIFETAHRSYDRIFILSDEQGWMQISQPSDPPARSFRRLVTPYANPRNYGTANPKTALQQYKEKYNASPKIYSWDLQNYGTMMFPEQSVICLSGFSEKVFDLIQLCEEDRHAMINKIKEVEI